MTDQLRWPARFQNNCSLGIMKNPPLTLPQPPAEIPALDALEQAMDCRENIFALALLLEDSAAQAAGDEQENSILSGTGRLIASETRKLKTLLDILAGQFPKPEKHPPKKSAK
jgi:hypothetical protein